MKNVLCARPINGGRETLWCGGGEYASATDRRPRDASSRARAYFFFFMQYYRDFQSSTNTPLRSAYRNIFYLKRYNNNNMSFTQHDCQCSSIIYEELLSTILLVRRDDACGIITKIILLTRTKYNVRVLKHRERTFFRTKYERGGEEVIFNDITKGFSTRVLY